MNSVSNMEAECSCLSKSNGSLQMSCPICAEEVVSSTSKPELSSSRHVQNGLPKSNKWIKLNVGGQHFVTTFSTIGKYPKSFLYRLCQENSDINSDKVN